MWEGQTVAWSLDAWMEKLQLDPARRTRNQHIIERCAQWGVENGFVLVCEKGRMQQDQRRVKYTMVFAPQRYGSPRPEALGEQERLQTLVEQFYTMLGTKVSAQKLARDTALAVTLRTEGFSLEDLTFAVEWAVQHIPSVTSFGLLPHIMHAALKARSTAQKAEEARREAEAQLQAHLCQQQEEEARAQRLEAFRAALAEDAIETFRCQAVEALAHEGYHERALGYSMLLKIRLEDLIEQAFLRAGAPGEQET
jgi:hypothetical protein